MAQANLTMSADVAVKAREIDFVSRFADTWEALREVLGIMRPIRKENGTVLNSKKATIVLQDGKVGEGENIPYSKASVTETPYGAITLEKYAKAVSIEAVAEHGAEAAIAMTDDAFLNELQGNVMDRFYDYIATGELTSEADTFQMAIAKAIGTVKDKFKKMRKNGSKVVVWVNTLDAYTYLGAAELTVQTQFGLDYIENFLGADKVILSSEIEAGKVIATPVDNIILYYVDPSNSGFRQLGLEYVVDGETNLIGFHAGGNYNTAVGESFALMGLTLFAEYIDAIAVVTVGAGAYFKKRRVIDYGLQSYSLLH